MSGLIVNILRRSKFYGSVSNKIFDIPVQTLILHKDFYLSGCLAQKQKAEAIKSSTDDKKTRKESIKITLIGKNNSMTVTSLEEAQKLSRRRDLKLVKVEDFDTKTQRPVYKMLSAAEHLAKEVASVQITDDSKSTNSSKKNEKFLNIGSRISDHDLSARLKNITKWMSKGLEVRVLIQANGENDTNVEKIFASVEAIAKESGGRIVQKHGKQGNVKFIIQPAKVTPEKDS